MPFPAVVAAAVPYIFGGLSVLAWLIPHRRYGEMLEDECNYFDGRWTYEGPYYSNDPYRQHLLKKPVPYFPDYHPCPNPLFPQGKNTTCPFIPEELDCLKKKSRPEFFSVRYKWKPNGCSLPSFSGDAILKQNKGKRFMFVGDSVGHDQYISFICMLYSEVQGTKYLFETKGDLTNLTFLDYNISVIFSGNDFLVDIDAGDDNERIFKLDSIGKGGSIWKDADVLIFNSWNEWLYIGQNKSRDVFEEGNTRHRDMGPLVAYQKAQNTLVKWVNSTLDTSKAKVYIMGVSPDHFNASDWVDTKAENCKSQTRPAAAPQPSEDVLSETLKYLPGSVRFINVAPMPQIRKDSHPSINGSEDDVDCRHWCLPGVPDAWNELWSTDLRGF